MHPLAPATVPASLLLSILITCPNLHPIQPTHPPTAVPTHSPAAPALHRPRAGGGRRLCCPDILSLTSPPHPTPRAAAPALHHPRAGGCRRLCCPAVLFFETKHSLPLPPLPQPPLPYTAPELVAAGAGTRITASADVFSLAAVAYEALAKRQLLPVASNLAGACRGWVGGCGLRVDDVVRGMGRGRRGGPGAGAFLKT